MNYIYFDSEMIHISEWLMNLWSSITIFTSSSLKIHQFRKHPINNKNFFWAACENKLGPIMYTKFTNIGPLLMLMSYLHASSPHTTQIQVPS